MWRKVFVVLLLLIPSTRGGILDVFSGSSSSSRDDATDPNDPLDEYGVDVTFPIHHYLNVNSKHATKRLFAERYRDYMKGCIDAYSKRECEGNERARVDMNFNQPRSQHNYTEMGFKKMRIPDELWRDLQEFWDENKAKERVESWPRGNTYVNHWSTPSYMVSTGERSLRLKTNIHQHTVNTMQKVLEEWTGKTLVHTSLYGIRVYKDGAMLATHVDRLPLVTSAILQIAQDIDEPWPVEVYSHDGRAYNVTMKPGDMVLYESHSVLHGRPFPLKGRYYANIFVHFQPTDHEEMNEKERKKGAAIPIPVDAEWAEAARRQMKQQRKAGKNEVGHEQQNHDDEVVKRHMKQIDGQTALHRAAAQGQLDVVEKLLAQSSDMLHARDMNDWQAVHEAARAGHLDTLKYLIDLGADFGSRTSNGATALWWAKEKLPPHHEVIAYLEGIGAPGDKIKEL